MRFDAQRAAARTLMTDSVTAYRTETLTDADGITSETERCIYAALPCRLSKDSSSAPDKGAKSPVSDQTYTLYTMPEVRFAANDRVTVTTHMGVTVSGRVGQSMVYDICTETELHIKELARHG